MPSRATCRLASPDEQIAAQRAVIIRFETALWEGGFNASLLASYQSAWRRLEALIAARGDDRRHHFVLVIPVADSPTQLRRCLASLLELCRLYGYGGMQDGRFRKVSVILADDSEDAGLIAENRAMAREFDAQGLAIDYFGLAEQLELMDSLAGMADLSTIVGDAPRDAFGHKGQARMRNIAYLELARLQETDAPLLFYTLDADQQFKVKVETADSDVCAVNFFAQLDTIFSATDADVLTGKVVGDPPVSPAVMAGNFLDDVAGFLREMAASDPARPYRQNAANTPDADAAYHDMAGLFGFENPADAYRYRCNLMGTPNNADCFGDFAQRLKRFFHGEHPTRITWYRHQPALDSAQPARTVYTGNYVFRPRALSWFIPFAPLRLRMSGPTLGRLMKTELGDKFISANLPMLHTRTLDATGEAEFRPGVVTEADAIDLSDEFERQFFGDVMLFTVERLAALGFPQQALSSETIAATLDAVHAELAQQYRTRHAGIVKNLDALTCMLNEPAHWWHARAHGQALAQFRVFLDNMQRNFGADSPGHACIASEENWQRWRQRQLAALTRFDADRRAWSQALAALTAQG
ncbi:hypothetical protein [Thiobacillus denitrificans]|uniref:Uncharacterized protein n=1 Tax=Thiobacillus denitrificans TaxID=36861 RepID=A0A106BJ25_THIDE|nr:hypothetical protein [Thiobacillus denitrificans]KVW93410.1 hypothetical protein ABW22_14915 [Thiobacillus denitrificans]